MSEDLAPLTIGDRERALLAGEAIDRWVIVDLEATTSDDGSLPRNEMETIEIGAVSVDARSLDLTDDFQRFVRPVRHPILLPFCTELTGISQAMVNEGDDFVAAFSALQDAMFSRGDRVHWASWGRFDDTQFHRDCAHHGIACSLPRHVNLKAAFHAGGRSRPRLGMAQALEACGLSLEGAHHRALDDARNIARMLPWIFGRRVDPAREGPVQRPATLR